MPARSSIVKLGVTLISSQGILILITRYIRRTGRLRAKTYSVRHELYKDFNHKTGERMSRGYVHE